MSAILKLTLVERAQRLDWLHWGESPPLRGPSGLSTSHPHLWAIFRSLKRKPEHCNEAYWITFTLWRAQLRYELGSPLACLDALHLCQDCNVPLPEYFVHALQGQIIDGILQRSDAQRGRGGSIWGRLQRLLAQQKQAKLYNLIRAWQREAEACLKVKKTSSFGRNPPPIRLFVSGLSEKHSALFDPFIPELRTAPEAASLTHVLLRGTWAQASPRSISDAAAFMRRDTRLSREASVAVLRGVDNQHHKKTLSDPRSYWINEWDSLHSRTRHLIEDLGKDYADGRLSKSEAPSRSSSDIPTTLRQ